MTNSVRSFDDHDWLWWEPTTPDSVLLACPTCSGDLTLHQPDPDLPESILGTCYDCKTWYLIEAGSTMIKIIRRASEQEKTGHLLLPADIPITHSRSILN